ncbi:MAG TPA: YceI family protein [Saprospiraceae bacterium]|nr:YceI family protein [Saprospiraceae bacterium]
MQKFSFLLAAMLLTAISLSAQKYFTREGKVSFFSSTPMENIEAHNEQGTAVLDLSNGNIEFAVLIKAFRFEKALMQEHFNENYMESTKYPKANFKGQVLDFGKINLKKDGTVTLKVKGTLTIKDVTKNVETEAVFVVAKGALSAKSAFKVAVADYNISIPKLVADKIAKTVDIKVDAALAPLNK